MIKDDGVWKGGTDVKSLSCSHSHGRTSSASELLDENSHRVLAFLLERSIGLKMPTRRTRY